jgi:Serine dehydrogenase proteinase
MTPESADAKALALCNEAASALDADLLFANGGIDGGLDNQIYSLVLARKRRKNVFLFLTTEGGSADTGFRIARCLQGTYTRFTAVVSGYCKSAGTLICIGAADLMIGDLGELGPLDVQLAKPDELGLQASGLAIDSAFRSLQSATFQMFESFLIDTLTKSGGRITTKTAAELSVNMTVGLLAPIFEQMEPLKIGEDYRSTRIAEEYALRLDAHAQNLIHGEPDAIEALVRGYPSHGFVIDRTEAKTLFRRVHPLEGQLLEIVQALGTHAIMPRSAFRSQQPILRYLNEEKADEQKAGAGAAGPGEKPPRRKKSAAGPDPSEPLPADTGKGNGNLAVPLFDDSEGARGKDAPPK